MKLSQWAKEQGLTYTGQPEDPDHRGRASRPVNALRRRVCRGRPYRPGAQAPGHGKLRGHDDLVQDMIEVLTSFCARLYGRRSARHKASKALHAMGQSN